MAGKIEILSNNQPKDSKYKSEGQYLIQGTVVELLVESSTS
jgi:hypothetical protein